MKQKILFVERKPFESVSIERVFRQIAKDLPADRFEVEFQQMPYGHGIVGTFMNLLFFRPKPADIYNVTGHVHYIALRLPKKRTVLTIHDLVFLRRRSGLRRLVLKWLFLKLPVKRLDFVTAVSRSTRDEIIKYAGVEANKIRIIENPLIDRFEPGDQKPFNEECPVILQIGTAANKNVSNLIHALRGIKCKLRIIGRLDANIYETLRSCAVEYENAFDLDQHDIAEEYRKADLVAFCSTYEGFGLPIIEAQAMRKPMLTSDLRPMREVAGGGAVLVDPNDIQSIRNGILKLTADAKFRNHVIELGEKNIHRFDHGKIASQYAAMYEQLLAND